MKAKAPEANFLGNEEAAQSLGERRLGVNSAITTLPLSKLRRIQGLLSREKNTDTRHLELIQSLHCQFCHGVCDAWRSRAFKVPQAVFYAAFLTLISS